MELKGHFFFPFFTLVLEGITQIWKHLLTNARLLCCCWMLHLISNICCLILASSLYSGRKGRRVGHLYVPSVIQNETQHVLSRSGAGAIEHLWCFVLSSYYHQNTMNAVYLGSEADTQMIVSGRHTCKTRTTVVDTKDLQSNENSFLTKPTQLRGRLTLKRSLKEVAHLLYKEDTFINCL